MRGENNLIPRFYCVTVTVTYNCVAVKGLCMRLGRELAQAVGSLFKSLGDLRRLQWQTLLNNFRTGWCSRVTRKVFRLLYPMNHLNCGRNDRTIPPLKPIPMVFFLLVYASSAMLCEKDGDGGGRGGVSRIYLQVFFFSVQNCTNLNNYTPPQTCVPTTELEHFY